MSLNIKKSRVSIKYCHINLIRETVRVGKGIEERYMKQWINLDKMEWQTDEVLQRTRTISGD